MTGAHHARELITLQMTLFQVLKLIHAGLITQQPKYRNLLAQNKYYVIPVVNPDGVAFIETEFGKSRELVKKRKNMNPQAVKSIKDYQCLPEDSGVDLNRNYGVDWSVSDQTQVGLGDTMYD